MENYNESEKQRRSRESHEADQRAWSDFDRIQKRDHAKWFEDQAQKNKPPGGCPANLIFLIMIFIILIQFFK